MLHNAFAVHQDKLVLSGLCLDGTSYTYRRYDIMIQIAHVIYRLGEVCFFGAR